MLHLAHPGYPLICVLNTSAWGHDVRVKCSTVHLTKISQSWVSLGFGPHDQRLLDIVLTGPVHNHFFSHVSHWFPSIPVHSVNTCMKSTCRDLNSLVTGNLSQWTFRELVFLSTGGLRYCHVAVLWIVVGPWKDSPTWDSCIFNERSVSTFVNGVPVWQWITSGKVLATHAQNLMHHHEEFWKYHLHCLTMMSYLLEMTASLRQQTFSPINPTLHICIFAEALLP